MQVLTDRDCPVHTAGGGVSKLELQENGTGGFYLTCRTHGRVTLVYTDPEDAQDAAFITYQEKQASKHSVPVAGPIQLEREAAQALAPKKGARR